MKITVETKAFASALKRVEKFCAKKDNRPVLECVYLEKRDNAVRLVGANGCVLGYMDVKAWDKKWTGDGADRAIIPVKALNDWTKSQSKEYCLTLDFTGLVEDKYHPGYAVEMSGIRCMPGFYPDYESIVPQWHWMTTTAICEAAEFNQAVKVVSVFKKDAPMTRVILNGCLRLEGQCATPWEHEYNSVASEVEYDKDGPDVTTFLDVNYLKIVADKTGLVVMGVNGDKEPVLFDSDGLQGVIMPMHCAEWRE